MCVSVFVCVSTCAHARVYVARVRACICVIKYHNQNVTERPLQKTKTYRNTFCPSKSELEGSWQCAKELRPSSVAANPMNSGRNGP
jgi:hypothetical protein